MGGFDDFLESSVGTGTDPNKKRILLKISGEALKDSNGESSFNGGAVERLAREIASVAGLCELCIIPGAGNLFRGSEHGRDLNMDGPDAHYVGMQATIINGSILRNRLVQRGIDTRHQTALPFAAVAEPYVRLRAIRHLEKGRVVIISGGTGNPYFSTDMAMVLRALEIGALPLKGTKVNGIFSSDPVKDNKAEFIETISHGDFLRRGLGIVDGTAVQLAKENNVPIRVFNLFESGALRSIIEGEDVGSLITSADDLCKRYSRNA